MHLKCLPIQIECSQSRSSVPLLLMWIPELGRSFKRSVHKEYFKKSETRLLDPTHVGSHFLMWWLYFYYTLVWIFPTKQPHRYFNLPYNLWYKRFFYFIWCPFFFLIYISNNIKISHDARGANNIIWKYDQNFLENFPQRSSKLDIDTIDMKILISTRMIYLTCH